MPSGCSLNFSLSFIISLEKWSKFYWSQASSCWRAFELPLHISRRRRCLESLSQAVSRGHKSKVVKSFITSFHFHQAFYCARLVSTLSPGVVAWALLYAKTCCFSTQMNNTKKGKIEEAKILRKKYIRKTRKISKCSTKLTWLQRFPVLSSRNRNTETLG